MPFDVDSVLLGQAQQQVAGDPHFVGGASGALAEDLEFPLALGDFRVDAFVVDAGEQAEVEMLFDDLAGNVADVVVADAGVIGTLRSGIAICREAERTAVLVEEVFLLEAEPRAGIVEDGRAGVGHVRRAIGVHDFAHHKRAVLAGAVGEHGDRLQHAIGIMAFGLLGRAAVKTPQRQFLDLRKFGEVLELRLAAQIRDRLVAIQPDILELIFRHFSLSSRAWEVEPVATSFGNSEVAPDRQRLSHIRHFLCHAASGPRAIPASYRTLGRP